MRLFFKFIAVFLALSLQIFSEEEIKYVKVEVASVVWKNQTTNESFPKVKNYSLASEILGLEIPKEPEINLDTIELAEGQVKIDFKFVEQIFDDNEDDELLQDQIIDPPKLYRVIDRKEHELNGTMRRISQIKDLVLTNHKSWFQPLLGTNVLKNSYLMSKSEFNVKPLVGNFEIKKDEDGEEDNVETELFILDEQRRISLDQFHYFDHPKIGLLVGVYSYPKTED